MMVAVAAAFFAQIGFAGAETPGVDGAPWVAWDSEVVDSLASVFGQLDIDIDSRGHPHVAYRGDDGLRYAHFNGLFWELSVLRAVGISASIAVDSQDRPHISYDTHDSTPEPWKGNLNYTYFDGMNWIFETVDSPGIVGFQSRIALDALDRPHILYLDLTNADAKYAYKDGTGWHVEVVDGGGPLGVDGLALDESGVAHGAYAGPFGQLRYAVRSGGVWSTQQVTANGGYSSIAVDSLGGPHIAYGASGVLRYASLVGGQWIIENADSEQSTGLHPSLDIDLQDRPHVSHVQNINVGNLNDPTRGHLKYAFRSASGAWSTEIVDRTTAVDLTSLQLDSQDRPRIAYGIWYRPLVVTRTINFDLGYAEPASALPSRLGP